MHESHRCAICSAEFGSSRDLVRHEQDQHRQDARGGTSAADEVAPESGSARERAGREFTRRNLE